MGDRALRPLALVAVVVAITLNAGPAHATNDSLWDQQWGPRQIHVEEAWAAGAMGAGVRVGVVDTGIDFNHPELVGKVVASAKCLNAPCAEGAGLAQDDEDHGTHVSGIIAARANNGVGIAGVANEAQLVVAKALDNTGGGSTADIAAGIRWAVGAGARVVNLSLGPDTNVVQQALFGGGPSDLRGAIEDAWNAGAVPVLASGNSSTGLPILSGSNNYGTLHAIVVGATDQGGALACYSSPVGNATWGIVAPGGGQTCGGDGIVSTVRDNKYAKMSGTSMATPHVSAVVAMLLGLGLDKQAAVDTLLRTADKSVSCGSTCAGRLDAARAVAAVRPSPTSTPTVPVGQPNPGGQPGSQQPPTQSGPQQPTPQQPTPQQPTPLQPGLRPAPDQPVPQPAPQPSLQPAPQPQPSPQPVAPNPQPIAPQPINLLPPEQPPAIPLQPAPPVAAFESTTTTTPPLLPPTPGRAQAGFSEQTTTTTAPPATTTTVAPEPRHTAAPATSRAVYDNTSGGGSTAEAIAAVSLLLGSAATGLALTRRPPPPDLL